jgi:hypothetical protein
MTTLPKQRVSLSVLNDRPVDRTHDFRCNQCGRKGHNRRTCPELKRPMTMKLAIEVAGTLGHPSKMPGFSYGISALLCITGNRLAKVPGSTCTVCYARTAWYRSWRPLLAGHERREQGLRHPLWVDAMVFMIERKTTVDVPFMRWHDSGDLRGVWHLENIVAVANRTPRITHWLPTREYDMVKEFIGAGGVIPPNLTVRLSAHMIDSEPVVPPELAHLPTSTVSTVSRYRSGVSVVEGKGSVECRAVEARDNKCGDCRACWSPAVRNVQYPQH